MKEPHRGGVATILTPSHAPAAWTPTPRTASRTRPSPNRNSGSSERKKPVILNGIVNSAKTLQTVMVSHAHPDHFMRVFQKRSILPRVMGWCGRLLMW